ncbi:MAG: CDC27 family protein [Sulfurovaceae bacterium]|nr:CDC27 family protein [Sulfurovaceae bacterium]
MHNIELLEKQWKRYQIKKYSPFVIAIIILFFLAIALPMHERDQKQISLSTYKINTPSNKKVSVTLINKPIESNISISNNEIKNTIDTNKSISIIASNGPKNNLSSNNTPILMDKYHKERVKINLEQTSDIDSVTDVISRFYESKNPDDSLFLAKNYYEQHDYDKAFYWAIETNKITEDLEESWIIMAKSKVKMGDRKEAIRILRAYTTKKDSKEASSLLSQLEGNQW